MKNVHGVRETGVVVSSVVSLDVTGNLDMFTSSATKLVYYFGFSGNCCGASY